MSVDSVSHPATARLAARELIEQWAALNPARRVQAFALLAATLLLIWCATMPAGNGDLVMKMTAPVAGEMQVYFDQGRGLSEEVSQKIEFPAGTSTLTFAVPQGTTYAFRIDPPSDIGRFAMESVYFAGMPANDAAKRYAGTFQRAAEVDLAVPEPGSAQTLIVSQGAADPQVYFIPDTPVSSASSFRIASHRLGWGLALLGFGLALAIQLGLKDSHLKLSVVALGFILALSSFAITSTSVNPDEDLHEADARYFSSHWQPPRLDSPDMQATYAASPYGVSYLSEWNVTYLLAGKFGKVAQGLGFEERTGYRLYQAALFAALIALIVLLRLPAAASIPLIVTPQAWYLFSYMNGDALPFACAFLAAAIAFAPASRVRLFLAGAQNLDLRTLFQVAIFILCMAALIISKRNYWPVAAFIGAGAAIVPLRLGLRAVTALSILLLVAIVGVAGGRALTETYGTGITIAAGAAALVSALLLLQWAVNWKRRGGDIRLVIRLGSVLTAAALVASPWIIQDYRQNGGGHAKQATVEALREAYAAPEFRPSSTAPAPGLKMREQGYSLRQLVNAPLEWQSATAKSFFGVYGYMKYYAAGPYYWLIGGATVLLLLLGIGSTLFMDPQGRSHLVLAIACATSLVAASLLHSWTYDFQAQGRYVMGLVVLMMPFMFQFRASSRIYLASNVLVAAIFLLGCYSFVAVAMPALIA